MSDDPDNDDADFVPTEKMLRVLQRVADDASAEMAAHKAAINIMRMLNDNKNGEMERVEHALERIGFVLFEVKEGEGEPIGKKLQLWFAMVVLGMAMDHVATAGQETGKHPFKVTVLTMYYLAMLGNEEVDPEDVPTAGNA